MLFYSVTISKMGSYNAVRTEGAVYKDAGACVRCNTADKMRVSFTLQACTPCTTMLQLQTRLLAPDVRCG